MMNVPLKLVRFIASAREDDVGEMRASGDQSTLALRCWKCEV